MWSTLNKVFTLANHKGRKKSIGVVKTQSKHTQSALSAGKHVPASHDLSWFFF